MITTEHPFPWLALMDRPAFCVKDGVVIAANNGAESRMLRVGANIWDIVTEHQEDYEGFVSGCLYLTITAGGIPCSACVTRTKEYDIFQIHHEADDDQLRTLALAAQQLRIPLANLMTVSDRLLSGIDTKEDSLQLQTSQMNHSLFQLFRIISNMSDASSYKEQSGTGMQTVNFTAVIDEIMEKAQTLSANTGITVSYTGLSAPVLGLANAERLERAIYNLLSNAIKFATGGSTVDVNLTKNGDKLYFAICNTHSDTADAKNFWNRFQREPAIEDSRYGLGLGMVLAGSVAAAHKGTVLVDHPTDSQTRVTMTIAVNKDNSANVRSPIMRISDYAGGRDKGLLEFAEILPTESYKKIN